MNKLHKHFTWVKENYQHKNYQSTIFTDFDVSMLSPMCIIIDKLVESIDLSCFEQYYKANSITGGRPNLDYAILLKIYMYYNESRLLKQAKETIESEQGIELYSHRGKCESPHGFIKYNLNGKKFKAKFRLFLIEC